MMKKMLLPLLLLLVFSGAGQAAEGAFRHYTTRDGLSSNTVQALIQDRAGLIWMGRLPRRGGRLCPPALPGH